MDTVKGKELWLQTRVRQNKHREEHMEKNEPLWQLAWKVTGSKFCEFLQPTIRAKSLEF